MTAPARSALDCGCDPGCGWICEAHRRPCPDCSGTGFQVDADGRAVFCESCKGKRVVRAVEATA